MTRIYENENGFIEEDGTKIRVMKKCMRNEDGIMASSSNETVINYGTGLYQEWNSCGYFAKYYDWCKDRNGVISRGKRMLEV